MKLKSTATILLLILAITLPAGRSQAQIPILEIIKAAVKKVVRAVDLQIQRQQNKVIWLQNAQRTVENTMSKLKLTEISQWTDKQRALYDDYFKELWRVKNAIATYRRVRSIVEKQLQLVEEYKRAWAMLQRDPHFSPQELERIFGIYSAILEESLKNIDQLTLVASSFATQMSDGQRLELIAQADKSIDRNLGELRRFSDRNFRLSLSRSSNALQAESLRKLYGIQR